MKRKYKIACIGCGNMGTAMISGILNSKTVPAEQIAVSARSKDTRRRMEKDYGVHATSNNAKLARNSSIIILAVKPGQFDDVAKELREVLEPDQIIISVMAGKTIAQIEESLISIRVAGRLKVVRAMPNTPAAVGESMTAVAFGSHIEDDDISHVLPLMKSFGEVEVLNEDSMALVTGLCGSSPAFVYMLIESMADEAVRGGMQRDKAYRLAAQTVAGAARMVLKTGEHPGVLKDRVCSPGGTTIAGVCALEDMGFRSAIMAGVGAAVDRAREL